MNLEESYQKLSNTINYIVGWTFSILALISFAFPLYFFVGALLSGEFTALLVALILTGILILFWVVFFWLLKIEIKIKFMKKLYDRIP